MIWLQYTTISIPDPSLPPHFKPLIFSGFLYAQSVVFCYYIILIYNEIQKTLEGETATRMAKATRQEELSGTA